MRMLSQIGFCVALAAAPFGVVAGTEFNAEHFVEENCTRCHDTSVYTRPDRRVTSLTKLDSQVRMCDANLGTKLFDNDIAAVVTYLNDNYYQFTR